MRGKVLGVISSQSQIGITPAYAGKSRIGTGLHTPSWDHPRLCGEKGLHRVSFPPVWRITPAYAGKSGQGGLKNLAKKDHPRLCGEK